VFSIIATMRSLVWAMILLVMIIYMFSVMFTQAIADHVATLDGVPEDMFEFYWGTLPKSMYTLFASLTNGLAWLNAVKPLETAGWGWVVVFIGYMCFTFLAVLNVITGVFCHSAIEGAQHDQEMLIQEALKTRNKFTEQVRKLFSSIDTDDSGCITIQELEEHMNDPAMQAYLEALELDASDAWTLFKLLVSGGNHSIDCDDFIMGCMRLKGVAKAIDLAQLMYENKQLRHKLACFMNVMTSRMEDIMNCVVLAGRQSEYVRADGTIIPYEAGGTDIDTVTEHLERQSAQRRSRSASCRKSQKQVDIFMTNNLKEGKSK